MNTKRSPWLTIICLFLVYRIITTLYSVISNVGYLSARSLLAMIFFLLLDVLVLKGLWSNRKWGAVIFILAQVIDTAYSFFTGKYTYLFRYADPVMLFTSIAPLVCVVILLVNFKNLQGATSIVAAMTDTGSKPAASGGFATAAMQATTRQQEVRLTECPHCGYTGIKPGATNCPQCLVKISSHEQRNQAAGRVCGNCGYSAIPVFKKECPGCFQPLD